jgi:hypothetical protein
MAEPRSPLEQALDLVVFAPIGLAITVVEELPDLAEKGRSRFQQRAATAKLVGQFAVAQGRRRFGVDDSRRPAGPPPAGSAPRRADGMAVERETPEDESSPPVRPSAGSPIAGPPPSPPPGSRSTADSPASEDLAIPGYDSLSASQVVQRLASLSGPELEAVAAYETATRSRRTILSRIAQLRQS